MMADFMSRVSSTASTFSGTAFCAGSASFSCGNARPLAAAAIMAAKNSNRMKCDCIFAIGRTSPHNSDRAKQEGSRKGSPLLPCAPHQDSRAILRRSAPRGRGPPDGGRLPANRHRRTSGHGSAIGPGTNAAGNRYGAARSKHVARKEARGTEAEGVRSLKSAPATLDHEFLPRLEDWRRQREGDRRSLEGPVDTMVGASQACVHISLVGRVRPEHRTTHFLEAIAAHVDA